MKFQARTFLHDRMLLVFLAAGVVGLIALVSNGHSWPRLFAPGRTAAVARGQLPPSLPVIHSAEMKDAFLLDAAYDRIGFDLDSVAAGYISVPRVMLASLPSNLNRVDGQDVRKALFVRALLPIILDIDNHLIEDRVRLLDLRKKMRTNITLSGDEVAWVMALADTYDQPDADLDALVKKIDIVPPSLALAQAIEESGWGTSRIARDQNALFGQFGQTDTSEWKYRSFSTLADAVDAYIHNLNTHRAYREFRQARAHMRERVGEIDADELAETLHRYSERGDDYVQTVRSIMRDNDLVAFDGARLAVKHGTTITESRSNAQVSVFNGTRPFIR